ncbi:MAG: type II toxin-antitoxin system VapC family toxin [Lautropia sp.]|nr:type II toxin-antitoxin system VapC family toxin [Lautropia sp.]
MLDTNMVSLAIRGDAAVLACLKAVPMAWLCISSITHAEIMYGLAKKPNAVRLHRAVSEFLRRVEVLPFDGCASDHYGTFRYELERTGKCLSSFDMMIAAHAHAVSAILVTHDLAFHQIDGLMVEDWAER